jgi:hypothetical protein
MRHKLLFLITKLTISSKITIIIVTKNEKEEKIEYKAQNKKPSFQRVYLGDTPN